MKRFICFVVCSEIPARASTQIITIRPAPPKTASASAASVCSELTGITAQKSSPEKTCTAPLKLWFKPRESFNRLLLVPAERVDLTRSECSSSLWWTRAMMNKVNHEAACSDSLAQRNIAWFYYWTLRIDHPGNAAERGWPPNCSHSGGYDVTAATGYDVTAANKLPQIFFYDLTCVLGLFGVCVLNCATEALLHHYLHNTRANVHPWPTSGRSGVWPTAGNKLQKPDLPSDHEGHRFHSNFLPCVSVNKPRFSLLCVRRIRADAWINNCGTSCLLRWGNLNHKHLLSRAHHINTAGLNQHEVWRQRKCFMSLC